MLRKETMQLATMIAMLAATVSALAHNKVVVIPMMEDVQEPTSKTIFVTKGRFTGALGFWLGGDAKRQAEADAPGSKAKGTYKARLGHIAQDFEPGRWISKHDLPYMLVDGKTKVADHYYDLTDGTIDHIINMAADGTVVGALNAWSDIDAYGAWRTLSNCLNWSQGTSGYTGGFGLPGSTDENWAWYAPFPIGCHNELSLICVEQ